MRFSKPIPQKCILMMLSTICFINLQAQSRFPETFHDKTTINNSFGYWSFESVDNHQLKDISNYKFHGYMNDSIKFTNGRKLRYYPSYYNPKWQDSTGVTRTAINLNGGFGIIDGIPFASNTKLNERIILSLWVEINPLSNGVVFSLGDSITGNGILVELESNLDSNVNKLSFSLLNKHNSLIKHDFKVLPLGWYWIMIDINPQSSNFRIRYDNHNSDTFINLKYTFNYSGITALPLKLGYSGSIAFGKNIFTGSTKNNFISVDDFFILGDLDYSWFGRLFDPANGTKEVIKEKLNIHPNPCSDLLNIEYTPLIRQIPNNTYKIIQYNGLIVQEGLLSETIDVSRLSSGVYVFKIGGYTQKFNKIQ